MAISDPTTTRPIRSEHVTWKTIEGESVLLSLETGIYYSLNDTGTAAWELFDGSTSLVTVSDKLCAQFDASTEQVRQDLVELTRMLLTEGLVKINEDTSTSSGAD